MKITFVLPTAGLCGGIRVVAIYAKLLKQLGHEIFVVSVAPASPTLKEQFKSLLTGKGWIKVDRNPPSHFDNLDIPHKIIYSKQEVNDDDVPDADVVVATFWLTAEWVANLSKNKGAKAYFVQGHEVFGGRGAATYYLPLHKIVISQYLLDLMEKQYGDSNLSFVPNSVDTEQFNAPVRGKQNIPTVGMLYAIDDCKGSDISLKALTLARQQIPNLRLIAFGVSNPIPELPLPENTEYIRQPPQDILKDIYSKCDAWLFGSRAEGFGLPILEAMACRTPLIATPAGAAPELVSDGAGILVQLENPEAMAEAIVQICQLSPSQWQIMSDKAYRRATSYSWQDATKLFEAALYKTIELEQNLEISHN
jgi:glycosyltransferase involved in cell wall biosynthesis